MSVTVIPRKKTKNTEEFWPNSAGWELYGYVNKCGGIPFVLPRGQDDDCPRPMHYATKRQTKEWARSIRINYGLVESGHVTCDMRLENLSKQAEGLYSGSLKALIAQWADFLDDCEGYHLV